MLEVGIPVYNALQTLPDLLDSLCVQTKKNFMVTLCIDGDNEDYNNIISTYRARGLKPKVLRCEENHGAGVARQYIIDNSICDYITFADADDLVNPRFVEVLYSEAKLGNYDIISASFIRENSKGADVLMGSDSNIITWMHGKIYKRQFLLEKNVRFREDLRLNEDAYFNMVAMHATKNKATIDEPLYIWRDYNGSVTRRNGHKDWFEKSYCDYIHGQVEALKRIYEINGDIYDGLVSNALKNIYYHYMQARYYGFDEEKVDEAISSLKSEPWMKWWLNKSSNWIYVVQTIQAGAVYDDEVVVFYKETFNLWANRLLKGENI